MNLVYSSIKRGSTRHELCLKEGRLRFVAEEWRLLAGMSIKRGEKMITRILIVAGLVLSCSLCLAEDFPKNTNRIKSLTAEQAADLVAQEFVKDKGYLPLLGLTSIDKDVAQELAKFKGSLYLWGLTSIDKDVAQELANFKGNLDLKGLTSIDKELAQELAKYKGKYLFLNGLTSIDEVSLTYLKSNPKIQLPEKYRN